MDADIGIIIGQCQKQNEPEPPKCNTTRMNKKKNSPVVQEEQVHSSSQAVRKPFSKGPEPIADYFKCGIGCLGAAYSH